MAISSKSPSVAGRFRHYVASGVWQCPGGGAHKWIYDGGDWWHCVKCSVRKQMTCDNYAWNDSMSYNLFWGMYRDLDTLKRRVA